MAGARGGLRLRLRHHPHVRFSKCGTLRKSSLLFKHICKVGITPSIPFFGGPPPDDGGGVECNMHSHISAVVCYREGMWKQPADRRSRKKKQDLASKSLPPPDRMHLVPGNKS